jgi:hypothetical protein
MAQGWAKRMLFLGNPNPCDSFYRKMCDAGDLVRPDEYLEAWRP